LYVSEDSELICALKQAYQEVYPGERGRLPLPNGGASYARTMDQGVAFGATFEGEETHPHMPNECMSLTSVERAMENLLRGTVEAGSGVLVFTTMMRNGLWLPGSGNESFSMLI